MLHGLLGFRVIVTLRIATLRTMLATVWAVVTTATTTIVVLTAITLLLVLALGSGYTLCGFCLMLLAWSLLLTTLVSTSSALTVITALTLLSILTALTLRLGVCRALL
jgi:hypothetical protein